MEPTETEEQAVERARKWREQAEKQGYTGVVHVVNPSPPRDELAECFVRAAAAWARWRTRTNGSV